MPTLSSVTKHYLWDFCFRLTVFLVVLGVYLTCPEVLDFTVPGWKNPVLSVLWLSVLVSMLAQLNPKSNLTTGCLKQYPQRYDPDPRGEPEGLKQAVKHQNRGALIVGILWLSINLFFGWLYRRHLLRVAELVLLCAFFFLCDLICVLFFCPFQTFIMKNRCCVNCRIFAWGSWMMAAPLLCVPHLYARTLVGAGILVLLCWEWRFYRHPERFWFGSNRHLQCANCREQLCRYKYPRSRRPS